MSRFLPYPLLTVALALTWLLLNAPITPGSAALALLVGVSVPAVMRALQPRAVLVRAPGTLARLAVVVLYDMVRSNVDVALIILGLRRGERRTGFVTIPLDLREPFGITVLSIILTGAALIREREHGTVGPDHRSTDRHVVGTRLDDPPDRTAGHRLVERERWNVAACVDHASAHVRVDGDELVGHADLTRREVVERHLHRAEVAVLRPADRAIHQLDLRARCAHISTLLVFRLHGFCWMGMGPDVRIMR